MKQLLPIIIILLAFSCNQKKKENFTDKNLNFKITNHLYNFITHNDEWNKNDILRKQTNEDFKNYIDSLYSNGEMEKMFLELGYNLKSIYSIIQRPVFKNKYSASDKDVLIKISSWGDYRVIDSLNNKSKIYFNLFAIIKESIAKTIDENEKYTLNGKLITPLSEAEIEAFKLSPIYSFETKIKQDAVYKDRPEYLLGNYLFKIDSISEFKRTYRKH